MAVQPGIGVLAQMEDSVGADTYFTIGRIIGEPRFSISRGTYDKTTHNTAVTVRWKEFGKLLKEIGELTFDILMDFSDATQGNATGVLKDLAEDEDLYRFRVLFPDGEFVKFYGIVTNWELGSPLEDGRKASLTVKGSGAPVFSGF